MTVSGHRYDLDSGGVQEALQGALPEPIHEHFVVINGRRWPPKQVLALVTGLDRADFTTHQARRALTRLGFTAARAASPGKRSAGGASGTAPSSPAAGGTAMQPQPLIEALRPFIGLWVAVRGDEVLVAALRRKRSWPGWPSTASAPSQCSASPTPSTRSPARPRNEVPVPRAPGCGRRRGPSSTSPWTD
jgi:hypothetical protein